MNVLFKNRTIFTSKTPQLLKPLKFGLEEPEVEEMKEM